LIGRIVFGVGTKQKLSAYKLRIFGAVFLN